MPRLSLTARAFLYSFVPVCLVLAVSFVALSAVAQRRIKNELRENLRESEDLLNRASREHSARTTRLIGALTESAGLKAAVGLLSEARDDPSAREQIRATIE